MDASIVAGRAPHWRQHAGAALTQIAEPHRTLITTTISSTDHYYRRRRRRHCHCPRRGGQCRPAACVCGQLRCRHTGPDTRSQTHGLRHTGPDTRSPAGTVQTCDHKPCFWRAADTVYHLPSICHLCTFINEGKIFALPEQFAPHHPESLNVCADVHGRRLGRPLAPAIPACRWAMARYPSTSRGRHEIACRRMSCRRGPSARARSSCSASPSSRACSSLAARPPASRSTRRGRS